MVKENIKLPDAGLTPVGHVTIDLMDESGNVVERQEKDNYVHTRLLELVGRTNMMRSLTTEVWGRQSMPHYFEDIVLTDNTASPNPLTERRVRGNLIAGGQLNSVYDSDFLGNFNSAESVIQAGYNRLVYDFGTATGNGTFQSIYTGNFSPRIYEGRRQISVAYPPIARSIGGRDDVRVGSYSLERWFVQNEEYMFVNGTDFNRTKKLRMYPFKTMEDLYNAQEWESFTLPESVYCVSLDTKAGNYYFTTSSRSSNYKVYRAPYDDPSNFTLVMNRDMEGVGSVSLTGFFVDNSTDTFIAISTNNGWRLNKSFQVLEELPNNNFYSIYHPSIGVSGKDIYLGNQTDLSYTTAYSLEDQWEYGSTEAKYSSYSSRHYYNIFRELSADVALEGTYYSYYDTATDNYVDLVANFGFFSRAVLDSPVTKTAQNTMKITYEFTMDDWII